MTLAVHSCDTRKKVCQIFIEQYNEKGRNKPYLKFRMGGLAGIPESKRTINRMR
jgi:hypothetical protein